MILLSGNAWDISRRFRFSTPRKSTNDTFSRVMTFSTNMLFWMEWMVPFMVRKSRDLEITDEPKM
jgi:hypothetical protein